jgi:hypothetical protein
VDEVSCIHWNQDEQMNSFGLLDDVSCIHWNRDEQNSGWYVGWSLLASIGARMNKTLSSYPLPSLVCALAGEWEREREREGRSLGCACGWDCLFCLWEISRIQSAGEILSLSFYGSSLSPLHYS